MATFKIVSGNPLLRPSTHHKAVFFLKDQWHFGQGDAAGWGWGFPRSSHPPLWLPPSHPIPPAYPSEPGATATAAVLLPAGAGLGSSAGCCCVHFTDISQRLAKD